jgi:hypothetical protein
VRTHGVRRVGPAAVFLAVVAFGCAGAPLDFLVAPGSRVWIIPVTNDSNRPAVLAVAKDEHPMGDAVGRAEPATVPPGANFDVRFTVPAGQGWAIFVNPGADRGALVVWSDVPPDRNGRLPLAIAIDAQGNPSVSAPGEPGWFGN